MAILDIDRLLEHLPRNRIRLVGIELEGAWKKLPTGGENTFHGDGSVKFPASPPMRVGEIVSLPMVPAAIPKWVKTNYPDKVNETCGLHIHMSFWTARHYHRLMTQDYQDTLVEYLTRWAKAEGTFPLAKDCPGCFGMSIEGGRICPACMGSGKLPEHRIWERLRGENKNCHLAFWPDEQVKMTRHGDQSSPDRYYKHGSRYTAVNYCFGVENRQTFEVRVLPMMDTPEQSSRALRRIIDITNSCLFVMKGRARKENLRFFVEVTDLDAKLEEEVIVL